MPSPPPLRVTILGSGTAVPLWERFPPCVLVEGGGETVLVDVGPGATRRLAQAGVALDRVTAVLLTHFHPDHCAGLVELLFGLRNPLYAGRAPLRLIAFEGLRALLDNLYAAWPNWLDPRRYELAVDEIEPGGFALGGLSVTAFPIAHTPQSLAYRFEDAHGAIAAISGDATLCEGLVDAARDTHLFVCESAFPDGEIRHAHLSPGLAGEAAQRAGTRMLCLTHFYPECDGHDLAAQAAATFTGEVVLAEDLDRFTFDADAARFAFERPDA